MATRTVVCPECGAEVPAGRLSCAACGTLLASVAGAARRPVADDPLQAGEPGDASPIDAVDAAAASSRSARTASTRARVDRQDRPSSPPIPPVLHDWTGPVPESLAASAGAASEARAATSSRKPSAGGVSRRRGARPADLVPEAPAESAPTSPEPDVPSAHVPDSAFHLEDDGDPDFHFDEDAPLGSAIPGAYVASNTGPTAAPTIVPTAAAMIGGRPATATSIAAASIVDGTVASVVATPRPDRWFSVPAPAQDASSTPGKAGIFSDLPFRAPGGVAGWSVAVGALFGAVAFVLPWAAVGVIGTQFDPTYTGQWGLANPADLVPMFVAIALLLMTLIPSRIPAWIRGVVLPILVGGWFLGIAWSYATGPFGLGWGVDAVAIGGIILVIGGAMGQRHAEPAIAPGTKSDTETA